MVSSLLITGGAHANTPEWVIDNSDNAEGIITQEETLASPQKTFSLSKVIVSGALKEDLEIAESAASIAHFNAKEIERVNATSLGDLLTYEPGINADESTSGGLENIRIRGVGDDKVLITVDGAPIPAAFGFGDYLATSGNYFDIDAMKSVDIIKGPMSTLYGGSALAGGIFMQTKDPNDFIKEGERFGGEAKIGHNTASRETLYSGTVAGTFNDKLSAFARLTYADGHERRNAFGKGSSSSVIGIARNHPNPADVHHHNLLTKLVYEANENHRFSATYENFKETVKTDVLSSLGTMRDALASEALFKKMHGIPGFPESGSVKFNNQFKNINKREQFTFRHDFNVETTLFDRGFWNFYLQENSAKQWTDEYRAIYYSAPNSPMIFANRDRYSNYKNKSFGIGAEFNKGWAQSDNAYHNFTYGFNYRQQKISTHRDGNTINQANGNSVETETFPNKSFPDSKVKEYGLFLQDRISLLDGQYEIIAGIRYDHYKLNPKVGSAFELANKVAKPSSMSEGRFSKRLAFLWHPSEAQTLFLNYSEGFKAPSFSAVNMGFSSDEYYYTSRSNPNLKPESSKSLELGWNYIDDRKALSLTGFYTKYNNFIEERVCVESCDATANMIHQTYGIYESVNLDKSYVYGLEAKANMDLFTVQQGAGVIGLNASLAYAKGREKGSKRPINSVEPLTVTLGLDYTYLDTLYVSGRIKAASAKRANDIFNNPLTAMRSGNIDRTAGYATVDLIAEYKLTRDITINGGLYNIFDKKYITWGNRQLARTEGDENRLTNPGFNAALSIKFEF